MRGRQRRRFGGIEEREEIGSGGLEEVGDGLGRERHGHERVSVGLTVRHSYREQDRRRN